MELTLRQNMNNFAISQYQGFTFNRGMVRVGDQCFGLKANSLCSLLDSPSDNGNNIQASITTGATVFKGGRKRVRSFHLHGQFESKTGINVQYGMDNYASPDSPAELFPASRTGLSSSGNFKFNGRRDISGEYLCVEVNNVNGDYFHIDYIESFIVLGSRR